MSAAGGLMNSQSAMGWTNGAVKPKKVEDTACTDKYF